LRFQNKYVERTKEWVGGTDDEQTNRAILADLDGAGIQIAQLEERQLLKQIEDRLIDLGTILSSTGDIVAILLERYKTFSLNSTSRKSVVSGTGLDTDPILSGLEERAKDILLYRQQVDALHAKVKGASQLASLGIRQSLL
jgi:hypothetical protein